MKIDELIKELLTIKKVVGNVDVKFIKESYDKNEEFEGDEESILKENIRLEEDCKLTNVYGSEKRIATLIKGHKIVIK